MNDFRDKKGKKRKIVENQNKFPRKGREKYWTRAENRGKIGTILGSITIYAKSYSKGQYGAVK